MGNGKPGFDKTKVKNEPMNNCTYTLCSLTLSKTRCQKKKKPKTMNNMLQCLITMLND